MKHWDQEDYVSRLEQLEKESDTFGRQLLLAGHSVPVRPADCFFLSKKTVLFNPDGTQTERVEEVKMFDIIETVEVMEAHVAKLKLQLSMPAPKATATTPTPTASTPPAPPVATKAPTAPTVAAIAPPTAATLPLCAERPLTLTEKCALVKAGKPIPQADKPLTATDRCLAARRK